MAGRKYHIRRLGILSVMRIAFFIGWLVGLFGAVIYMIVFLFASQIDPQAFQQEMEGMGGMSALLGGAGALFVLIGGFFFSIVYAIYIAVTAGIGAAVYNALARVIGGVSLDLELDLLAEGQSPDDTRMRSRAVAPDSMGAARVIPPAPVDRSDPWNAQLPPEPPIRD